LLELTTAETESLTEIAVLILRVFIVPVWFARCRCTGHILRKYFITNIPTTTALYSSCCYEVHLYVVTLCCLSVHVTVTNVTAWLWVITYFTTDSLVYRK